MRGLKARWAGMGARMNATRNMSSMAVEEEAEGEEGPGGR